MGTTVFLRDEQLERWNLLRLAYGFEGRGNGTDWVNFVLDCMEEIDLLGYVQAHKTVDEMRRDFYERQTDE